MCIRDRSTPAPTLSQSCYDRERLYQEVWIEPARNVAKLYGCLLYTSDAADERSSVDLGGRRIIKKKNNVQI